MGAAIEAYKWEKGEPKKKLTQYRGELQRKLDELLGATREAEGAAVQKSACAWKRYKPNELGQKISEARNLAAHVERLLAALDWAQESLTGCHVLFCDPTTSDEAHDLVIKSGADRVLVFEASDVAGKGNSNDKMYRDLWKLLRCGHDDCKGAETYLAVSPESGDFLEKSYSECKKVPIPKRATEPQSTDFLGSAGHNWQ